MSNFTDEVAKLKAQIAALEVKAQAEAAKTHVIVSNFWTRLKALFIKNTPVAVAPVTPPAPPAA